jgi:Tol biopolymer transport system component
MRFIHVLPIIVMGTLPGCDGTGAWLRGQAATAAYAAPLASDTTVVTMRRVWSTSGNSLGLSTIMPDGAGLATTDWNTGDPAILHLASGEFNKLRINAEPYGVGTSLSAVPSPDGSRVAVNWRNNLEPKLQLRVVDVATGEPLTIMAADTSANDLWPVAWTPAGDSVFAFMWPRSQAGDVKVMLVSAAGGSPRLVHAISANAWPWRASLSPDGRWLLYGHRHSGEQQMRSDIYVIDVHRGGARALMEHPSVDVLVGWLPGTDVVLFSSDRSGTTDLWSVRVENGRTSAEPGLVRSGFFRTEAVGFGDDALFYSVQIGSHGPSVIHVDPRSGALHGPPSPPLEHLSSPPRAMTWSADGHTLAVPSRGRWNSITLHSMEPGESRALWLGEGVVPLRIEWAADGKTLFVRAGRGGAGVPTGPHHFLRLDPVTGTTKLLFAAEDPEEPPPLWSFLVTPDGRSIVLRQQRTLDDGRTEMNLVLRSLEDGSERVLRRTSGYIPEFSLSADGTQLAFMQQVWGSTDSLFVMRMDGSEPLRAVAGWDYDVVSLLGWLPSGTSLLAARLTEDGASEDILRVELDGSVTMVGTSPFKPMRGSRTAQGYYRSRLVLSPAGNRLAHHVIVGAGEELWRMDGLHELFARHAAGRR